MNNENDSTFPLEDENSIEFFFDIVVQQMNIRGYGYESLSVKIIPDSENIDFNERKKISGQLKRLQYNGAKIRDKRTLEWLWGYFGAMQEWMSHLDKLQGKSVSVNHAYSLNVDYGQSPEAIKSTDRLRQAISDDNAVFVIDMKYPDNDFAFIKFYEALGHDIFGVLLLGQTKTNNYTATAEDWKVEGYEFGHLSFHGEESGLIFWKQSCSKLFLKTLTLASNPHTAIDCKGKLINNSYQLTELFWGEERRKKLKVKHAPDDNDPFCENMYTLEDARKLFPVGSEFFDIALKNIDEMNVNLI